MQFLMKNIRFPSTACGSCEEGKSVNILTHPRHSTRHLPSPADKTASADGGHRFLVKQCIISPSFLLAGFVHFYYNAHALLSSCSPYD